MLNAEYITKLLPPPDPILFPADILKDWPRRPCLLNPVLSKENHVESFLDQSPDLAFWDAQVHGVQVSLASRVSLGHSSFPFASTNHHLAKVVGCFGQC